MNISVKSFYYEIRPTFQITHKKIETLSYCSYFKNHVNMISEKFQYKFSFFALFHHIFLFVKIQGGLGVFKPHNITYPGSANAKEVLIPSQKANITHSSISSLHHQNNV